MDSSPGSSFLLPFERRRRTPAQSEVFIPPKQINLELEVSNQAQIQSQLSRKHMEGEVVPSRVTH